MTNVIDGPWSKLQSNARIENATELGMAFGQNTIVGAIAMFKTAMSSIGKTDEDAKRAIAEIHSLVAESSSSSMIWICVSTRLSGAELTSSSQRSPRNEHDD